MVSDLSVTEQLANYAAGVAFDDLPGEVVHAAKRAILDSLGCSIGGSRMAAGRLIQEFYEEIGGKGQARVLASGRRLPLLHAAYINAALANLLDFDDSLGEGHLGSTIVPPVVSATAAYPTSGQGVIAAVVAGYEVSARIGTAIRPSPERFRTVRGLGTFQVFGTAAALGRLLELDEHTMASAFGIAGANAPVPSVYKEGFDQRPVAWVKNNFGWAAQGGVLGVLLAKQGFHGHPAFLDGERGFWRMAGSDRCDFQEMITGLGREYRILNNSFKPYSCCRYHHSSLDAVHGLLRDHELTARDIRDIHVRSIWRISEHMSREPQDLIDAQYSLPYQIAGHVLGRAARFDWMLTTALSDPEILAMARLVRYSQDDEHEGQFQRDRISGSTVTLTTSRTSHVATATCAWGSPQRPIGDADLEQKFIDLAGPVLGDEHARAMAGLVWELERIDNVDKALGRISLNMPRHG